MDGMPFHDEAPMQVKRTNVNSKQDEINRKRKEEEGEEAANKQQQALEEIEKDKDKDVPPILSREKPKLQMLSPVDSIVGVGPDERGEKERRKEGRQEHRSV